MQKKSVISIETSGIFHTTAIKGDEGTCVEIASEMKNALDRKTCQISIFSENFSPYNHGLAALFIKWKTNFPRL